MTETGKILFSAFISAVLSLGASYFIYADQIEISELDLNVEFNPTYFSKPEFPKNDIALMIDKGKKEKVGIYQISIVNFSKKELLDIPISIKVTPPNPSKFIVLAHSAVGDKGIANIVSESKEMHFDGKSYNFEYTIGSLNRKESEEPGFQLKILFEGDEKPELSVVPKGIGVRDYSPDNKPNQTSNTVFRVLFSLILFVVMLVAILAFVFFIFSPIFSHATQKWDIKIRNNYAKSIYNSIKSANLRNDLTDEQLVDFVADLLHQNRLDQWNLSSKIWKWSQGLIEPVRSDYITQI
jgi:hypothetical protein